MRSTRLLEAPVGRVTFIIPGLVVPEGTGSLLIAFALMNLLVLLEVADRLSLKNDLEIAREIQQAMLPSGLFAAPGVETVGLSRPANTVGGDFYDILPLDDGRLIVAVGDVAGKGSPAALLMALLLAMMRTLVDERLEPAELVTRLNVQVSRHAPGTRFITLFYGVYDRAIRRADVRERRPHAAVRPARRRRRRSPQRRRHGARHVRPVGVRHRTHHPRARRTARCLQRRHHRSRKSGGQPFDDAGLEAALRGEPASRHVRDRRRGRARGRKAHGRHRFADDLTILLLRRTIAPSLL